MSDADKAYAAAEAEIARVKAAGETTLDLDYSHYNALTDLPPEIAELTALTWINLGNTQITSLTPIAGLKALKGLEIDNTQVTVLDPIAGMKDMETLTLVNTRVSRLEPIAGLTALSRLWIGGTGVTDLRPIRALERLGESDWPLDGLHFENTPFADANDETRRLAAITDRHERTRKTLAFLNTLPPPPAPLPWETGGTSAAQPDPTVKTAETQINALLKNALLTRITADQFADQIETALRGIPATHGNHLAPPLQTMAEVATILRHLADHEPSDEEILERAALKLRISQLEALVERLQKQLSDETQAREAAEALAAKDGFWKSYRKSAGQAAGFATVTVFTIGVPSAAVYFLGAEHPLVRSVLTVLGRLPD